MPCYIDDHSMGVVYADCVLDRGRRVDCAFALKIDDRSKCKHWSDEPRGADKKRCPHCGEVIE